MTQAQEIVHDEGQPGMDVRGAEEGAEIETRARRLGWRPQAEFSGDPDKWVDSAEFMRRAETDPEKIKYANKILEKKLSKLEGGMAEILAHQQRELEATRKRAYDEAVATLEARHKQAVEAGDVEGADKAWKAKDALDRQAVAPPVPPKKGLTEEEKYTVEEWKTENEWFDTDPMMAEAAIKYEQMLLRKGVPLQDRLAQTTQYIQRKFPQEFETMTAPEDETPYEQPKRQPAAAPRGNSGNRSGVRTPPKKPEPGSYEALTPAARAQCDRFVSMHKNPKAAKAEWLKFATPDLFIA